MGNFRSMTVSFLIAGGVLVPQVAQSLSPEQPYPARPVRVITGSAGSTVDVVTRQIGLQLSERWNRPVVVDNRGGAGLTIGTAIAAKAIPDGYTLLMSDRSAIAVAPSLYKNLPYAPMKDFAPITLVAVASFLLVAHPSLPAANLREFIDYAKRHPGTVTMSVAASGTGNHIATELFKQAAGVNVLSVQYKGGGAGMLGVLSGETKAGFFTGAIALPHVKNGKLRAYAFSGKQRFAGMPDIPTMAESGLHGSESEYWMGMFAPAGVPAPLVARLNSDVVQVLETPAMQAAFLTQGAVPGARSSADFAAFIRNETIKMKKVMDLAGIRPE